MSWRGSALEFLCISSILKHHAYKKGLQFLYIASFDFCIEAPYTQLIRLINVSYLINRTGTNSS